MNIHRIRVNFYSNHKEELLIESLNKRFFLGLCLNGPKSMLDQTQYCQAATVVTSLAAVEMLYRKHPDNIENCMAVAGFSVGEITAAIFTGALSLGEGINLVKIRGEAMQAASDLVESGMATVFIGADSKLGFGCQVREGCSIKLCLCL